MNKQQRTFSLIPIIAIIVIAIVLLLLFVPDMSTTLIDTVPEYPPELNSIEENYTSNSELIFVDKSNVKSVVSALKRPSEYFVETQSVLSHESGSSTYIRNRWTKGNLSRIDILNSDKQPQKHYLYNQTNIFIWRPGSTSVYKTAKGNFDADDEQMLMTHEDIALASDENISTAQLTLYDGISCIYAEIKKPLTGYTERYWISTSTGLLLHGQTLDRNNSIIYNITATQTDVSPQSIELFRLPDGTIPNE